MRATVGLHWRVWRIADEDLDASALPDVANLYYYDAMWRLLEERVRGDFGGGASWANADPAPGGSGDLLKITQRFWCLHYIDDLIAWQTQDEEPDGAFQDGDALFYALTDRLYSVIGVMDGVGADYTLIERVRYTAYGSARHIPFSLGDANGDGFVTFADFSVVLARYGEEYEDEEGAYTPDGDFGLDGEIDFDDYSLVLGFAGQGLPEGALSLPEVGNTIGYTGHHFDPATGMTLARFRWFEHDLGRWVNRDPAGYADGGNMYEYAIGSPTGYIDPFGLWCLDTNGDVRREDGDSWDDIKHFTDYLMGFSPDANDAFDPSRIAGEMIEAFLGLDAAGRINEDFIRRHCDENKLVKSLGFRPSAIWPSIDAFTGWWSDYFQGMEQFAALEAADEMLLKSSSRAAVAKQRVLFYKRLQAIMRKLGLFTGAVAIVDELTDDNRGPYSSYKAISMAGYTSAAYVLAKKNKGKALWAMIGGTIGIEMIAWGADTHIRSKDAAALEQQCLQRGELQLRLRSQLHKAVYDYSEFQDWHRNLKPCKAIPACP